MRREDLTPREGLVVHHCGGCRADSDMTCPSSEPLEALLDDLADAGYDACFSEIDAQRARSPFSRCTNCGARGRFTYTGVATDASYRAFWSCRRCGHWMEV